MIKQLLGFFLLSTISSQIFAGISVSITSKADVKCYGESTGSATASVSGASGPTNYSWTPSFQNTLTATGLHAGVYTITVEDGSGPFKSTVTASVFIQEPSAAINISTQSTQNVSCNGGNDGSATINVTGGWGNYNYFWAPTGGTTATATGLSALNYLVQVSDMKGCSKTATVGITQPTKLNINVANTLQPKCSNDKGGIYVAAFAGTPGYTYTWYKHDAGAPPLISGASNYLLNLTAEKYVVVVTDSKGCTASVSDTIVNPLPINTIISSTDVLCSGDYTGTASVIAFGGTGPLSYSWNTGTTSSALSGLAAGTYSLSVTDTNNCKKDTIVNIYQSMGIVATVVSTSSGCHGDSTGAASVNFSGGTSPYIISWSPYGGTTTTASNLTAGLYTVNIADQNGCTASQTIVVTSLPPISINVNVVDATQNQNNGSAAASASGGTGAYTYTWSNNSTSNVVSGLSAGIYTLTVTDVSGCAKTQTITINNAVGISESSLENAINVYPNPASTQLTILISSAPPKKTKAELFNAQGVLVNSLEINEKTQVINLEGLSNGLYLLKVSINDKNINKYIIKE